VRGLENRPTTWRNAGMAFANPNPSRQLTYASPLEAKRAIAQCLGRALATLPTAQLEAINLVVTTTLNKQEVLGQLRACLAHPPMNCVMLSDIRSYYGPTRRVSVTGQSTYFETTHSQRVVKETETGDQRWQADRAGGHRRHRQDEHPAQSPGSAGSGQGEGNPRSPAASIPANSSCTRVPSSPSALAIASTFSAPSWRP
jgi:hypothetical protein